MVKGLAYACLTVTVPLAGLPCNAALTPLTKKGQYHLQFVMSNGYNSYERVNNIVQSGVNQENVDTLFGDSQIMQIEVDGNLSFLSRYFNASYEASLKGFSVTRNEASPVIELNTMDEKSFRLQSGLRLFRGFYVGGELRAVEQGFVKQQFSIFELLTETGNEKLKPKKQQGFFVEPSMIWIYDVPWKPKWAVKVANLGVISDPHDEVPMPVEPQVGVGITPPVGAGKLELALDYRSLSYEEGFSEKIHFGGIYSYGAMSLVAGVDQFGVSAGALSVYENFNAGILYSATVFLKESDFYTQTVYLQVSWQI